MFGRTPTDRIKAAENALAQGRLDEVFNLVLRAGSSEDRRISRLRDGLIEAFLTRGQDHMLGKRFEAALNDFDQADRCLRAGDSAEAKAKIRDWQRRAREAMATVRRDQAARDEALDRAKQRLEAGSLVGAADALADSPADDSARAAISHAIDSRIRQAEAFVAAAGSALKSGNIGLAVEKLLAARSLHNKVDGAADVETRLVETVVRSATERFIDGRLDRAQRELAVLADVGRTRPERVEIEKAVRIAGDAARSMSQKRFDQANLLMGRLAQVGPQAAWVSEVREHLGTLQEHGRALLEGPLGLLLGQSAAVRPEGGRSMGHAPLPGGPLPPTVAGPPPVLAPPIAAARPARHPRTPGLPRRLLLRIDGVGSFLLLRGDRIGIGRGGPGSTADLPLLSDLAERQAEIVHAGEDYFIVSQTGVDLAGRRVDHALLQDGDRIRLSRRAKLTFRLPTLKSSAAALDLGDGLRTATDCRRVILWNGPILMGPSRECHVHLDHRLSGFLLMERGGQLYVKAMGPGGEPTRLVLGEQTALTLRSSPYGKKGELRFSVIDWSNPSGAGGGVG